MKHPAFPSELLERYVSLLGSAVLVTVMMAFATKRLKGQLSLEFLSLFGINISAFIFILPLITNSKLTIENEMTYLMEQNMLSDLSDTADIICILGPGNKRIFYLKPLKDVNISAVGSELIFERSGQKQVELIKCKINIESVTLLPSSMNSFSMENRNGTIFGSLSAD
mgnify:CR=1 FL=1